MNDSQKLIEIRPALAQDAGAACLVLRRSITECCVADHCGQAGILDGWLGNKTADNVASWIASPSNYTLVAVREGEVVGVSLLTQAGKLSLCYLLPEALHQGVGKAMLQAVERQARSWGISVLRLHSTATARDFYLRNGYISAGKEKSCYGVECDFLWKKLNADPADDGNKPRRFCNCSAQ
ncbi:GNAT family N-acetyltransferase [Massilia sp. PAMC28688]|uniref:GNAT family N-acetyltransferase n=1 Tax=Massilia sp. PAMC28688 TaxID=2861283 RepID=UPI001C635A45|nr:GNAT family N-acetyltransferase [Massilia sp. PAMC28688]QYF92823.1 GNAT family N-acetyltransferase [Massilia sp. PAMC28688]